MSDPDTSVMTIMLQSALGQGTGSVSLYYPSAFINATIFGIRSSVDWYGLRIIREIERVADAGLMRSAEAV
jgi:hypothetical protein